MIALGVADLVVIAGRTLGLDTAQVMDLLDLAAAERALAQARPGRDPGHLARQAAVLLEALLRGQPQVLGLLRDECEQAGPQTQLAADLADAAERLTRVRQQKEAAFDAGDLDGAAALRDQERQLLAEKQRLETLLTADWGGRAIIAENERLHRELDRLRALLRQHGIEPDGGTARTA